MNNTVSTPLKWDWILLDLAGGAALMLGALTVFVPEVAADIGIPASWGWPLIVVGGVATLAAILLFFHQRRGNPAG